MTPVIVIIDDQRDDLDQVQSALGGLPFTVVPYANPRQAVENLQKDNPAVLLTALQMADFDGFDVLQAVQHLVPACKTVILTGYGRVEDAVRAIKSGASDFLTKPLNPKAVPEMVQQLLTLNRPGAEAPTLPNKDFHCGAKLRPVLEVAKAAAQTDYTVLLTGETGVGKEVFADYIQANSARTGQPYIKVNCAALSETLIESELFGHEQGAFTGAGKRNIGRFERANHGTLLLDEIGELSPGMQTKLLRVLETREIERVGGDRPIKLDFRLICATHRNLQQMLSRGDFRQDLFYRINMVPVHIPSLSERPDEIPELAGIFMAHARTKLQRGPNSIEPEAVRLLQTYAWPGNIRELANCVERACLLCPNPVLRTSDFWWLNTAPQPDTHAAATSHVPAAVHTPTLGQGNGPVDADVFKLSPLETAERSALKKVLAEHKWNFTHAAASLGISRSTLHLKARKYGLVRAAV